MKNGFLKLRVFAILLLLVLIISSNTSCSSNTSQSVTSSLGQLQTTMNGTIANAEFTDLAFYYGSTLIYPPGLIMDEPDPRPTSMTFAINITPNFTIASNSDETKSYTVLLVSADKYVYTTAIEWWDNSNFVTPNNKTLTLFLSAPLSDNDTTAILIAYGNLYAQRVKEARSNNQLVVESRMGSGQGFDYDLGKYALTQSDYQKLITPYMHVIIADDQGLGQLVNQGYTFAPQ